MTEDDTFKILKRRSLQEVYDDFDKVNLNLRDYVREQGYTVNEFIDYWALRQNASPEVISYWKAFYATRT